MTTKTTDERDRITFEDEGVFVEFRRTSEGWVGFLIDPDTAIEIGGVPGVFTLEEVEEQAREMIGDPEAFLYANNPNEEVPE